MTAPPAPDNSYQLAPSGRDVRVSWTNPEPEGGETSPTGMRVYRRESRDGETWSDAIRLARPDGINPDDGQWDDASGTHRMAYQYRVGAVDADGAETRYAGPTYDEVNDDLTYDDLIALGWTYDDIAFYPVDDLEIT